MKKTLIILLATLLLGTVFVSAARFNCEGYTPYILSCEYVKQVYSQNGFKVQNFQSMNDFNNWYSYTEVSYKSEFGKQKFYYTCDKKDSNIVWFLSLREMSGFQSYCR